jgi:hypothetical protein
MSVLFLEVFQVELLSPLSQLTGLVVLIFFLTLELFLFFIRRLGLKLDEFTGVVVLALLANFDRL